MSQPKWIPMKEYTPNEGWANNEYSIKDWLRCTLSSILFHLVFQKLYVCRPSPQSLALLNVQIQLANGKQDSCPYFYVCTHHVYISSTAGHPWKGSVPHNNQTIAALMVHILSCRRYNSKTLRVFYNIDTCWGHWCTVCEGSFGNTWPSQLGNWSMHLTLAQIALVRWQVHQGVLPCLSLTSRNRTSLWLDKSIQFVGK